MAASAGKLAIVKLLHQYKINLHAQDINGETAIHHAVRSNNVDTAKTIIEYLVHAGASLDVQNRIGETALHIAARYGCAELVHCLCMCGADLDLQDDVSSLCHLLDCILHFFIIYFLTVHFFSIKPHLILSIKT